MRKIIKSLSSEYQAANVKKIISNRRSQTAIASGTQNPIFLLRTFIVPQLTANFVKNFLRKFSLCLRTRAVQKVSGHFEYLENQSRELEVNWQPIRGDLTAHP